MPPLHGSRGNVGDNVPIAYFLTFTSYGTWLHGDKRGSVDPWHRIIGTDRVAPSAHRVRLDARRRLGEAVTLDAVRRKVVDDSVRETCMALGWHLLALNVRTNHIHVVVAADRKPEQVMTTLKAWCTRRMREAGAISPTARTWSRHGSTRHLWKEEDVEAACRYVTDGQGDPPPD